MRLGLLALACALLAAARASADPITFVQQRENYLVFDDVNATVQSDTWGSRGAILDGWRALEQGYLAHHPDDGDFLIIYTTWRLTDAAAFYQAMANDVTGIGYEHHSDPTLPATTTFDDTPGSRFKGFLHMADFHAYMAADGTPDDEAISLVFGQELGHAWLATVYFDQGMGAGPQQTLLGRDASHWSFYLHTGGSPVEGNDWTDNGDGTFTARKLTTFQFSDLDLYLMGLVPPAMVRPFFLIENPTNCVDSALANMACAAPTGHQFRAAQYRVTGTKRVITIDDVIRAEGARAPAYPNAPSHYGVSFILVKRAGEQIPEADLVNLSHVVDRSVSLWVAQTRGFASLDIKTRGEVGGAHAIIGNAESTQLVGFSIKKNGRTIAGGRRPIRYRSRSENWKLVSLRAVNVPSPLSVQSLPSTGEPPVCR